ncbi:MAG TPA: alpha/beta hydrolase [Candidatus Dormibacteraeota bacterium]|nr:alpha/beta hydrolase [Candidatus Dormibacteraeota bacterium]
MGSGPPVVLLHGWPGDRQDYRQVLQKLGRHAEVIAPDLRGFGESDKHPQDPTVAYSASAQARSVLQLIEELGLERPLLAGYDIGSRIAQTICLLAPERVLSAVLCPPLPGAGQRILAADSQREYWYQAFHQLELAAELIDGDPRAVRAYLRHFWSHWSGPEFHQAEEELERLVADYAKRGAFTASIAWYRAGSGTVARSLAEQIPDPDQRVSVPALILWPEHDPLYPQAWSDRVSDFFSRAVVRFLPRIGHFVPVEAPTLFVSAIEEALDLAGGHR